MTEVNIHYAKTHLSRLLKLVAEGEDVIIAKSGKPVARLVPMEDRPKVQFGTFRGLIDVPNDFDDPLPEEILKDFEE